MIISLFFYFGKKVQEFATDLSLFVFKKGVSLDSAEHRSDDFVLQISRNTEPLCPRHFFKELNYESY